MGNKKIADEIYNILRDNKLTIKEVIFVLTFVRNRVKENERDERKKLEDIVIK